MSQDGAREESPRGLLLGCLAGALIIILMCVGVRSWLAMPRVQVAHVERLIADSLPSGTSGTEVEAGLASRRMAIQRAKDDSGQPFIQSWIPDSGTPGAGLAAGWVKDIRIRFFLDGQDRLTRFIVVEEDRF